MLEHLYAPYIDLVELDACATRLAQCIRILSNAPPPGLDSVGVSGVADGSILDTVPGLPLLHVRRIANMRIGRMDAYATWTLGTSDDRRRAVVTTEVSCPPALGKVVVVEEVRQDLSNAPGPGDKDAVARIAASIRRLHDLVKTQADALRISLAAGDPEATVERGMQTALTAVSPFVDKACDESPEEYDPQDITLSSGAPYRRARVTYEDERHDMDRHVLLTDAAEEALQGVMPPIVALDISHFVGGLRYVFGPCSRRVDSGFISDDPIQALRWHGTAAMVPTPAWRERRD